MQDCPFLDGDHAIIFTRGNKCHLLILLVLGRPPTSSSHRRLPVCIGQMVPFVMVALGTRPRLRVSPRNEIWKPGRRAIRRGAEVIGAYRELPPPDWHF
jgi:hypothetical protein